MPGPARRAPRHPPVDALAPTLLAALSPWLAAEPVFAQEEPTPTEEVAPLRARIDASVQRGIEYLFSRQQRDGSWAYQQQLFRGGQTGLCVYALLKAGVDGEHATIQRGLAYLRTCRPTRIYAIATQVMALAQAGHSEDRALIEEQLDTILALQTRGSWDYPNGGAGALHRVVDLSITQFALLAMRAAASIGIAVPGKHWLESLSATFDYQHRPTTVDGVEIAGFHYKLTDVAETASMTTAGITALTLISTHAPRLSRSQRRAIEQSTQLAVAWLTHNYSVSTNPGGAALNLHYYLYGLERVCSLLELDKLGDHDWYRDGAEFLVDGQADNGSWRSRHAETDTCFALLFLERASAPVTGSKRGRKRPEVVAEAPENELGVRAVGGGDGTPVDLWLSRIGPTPTADAGDVWHVHRVEYFANGEPLAALEGNASQPWQGEAYAARHVPERNGNQTYEIVASVSANGEADGAATLRQTIEVAAKHVLEPWMLRVPGDAAADVLQKAEVAEIEASSEWKKEHSAGKAFDGMTSSSWLSAADDAEPRLRIDLRKPIRARVLVLEPPAAHADQASRFDLPRRYRITVNNRAPVEVEAVAHPSQPTYFDLERLTRIKRLEIAFSERSPGANHPGIAGLARVLLLPTPSEAAGGKKQ